MTGAGLAAAVPARAVSTLTGPARFDDVLAGVELTGPAAALAGVLEAGFLLEAGWDPAARVLSLPAAHPLLGRTLCRIRGCGTTVHGGTGGVCSHCFTRLRQQGLSLDQIAGSPDLAPLPARPEGCAVANCQRMSPAPRSTLCEPHRRRFRRKPGASLEQFLADQGVQPLPPLGACRVAACSRAESEHGYCPSHYVRWRSTVTANPDTDQRHWQLTQPAIAQGGQVSLRGLPSLMVIEIPPRSTSTPTCSAKNKH